MKQLTEELFEVLLESVTAIFFIAVIGNLVWGESVCALPFLIQQLSVQILGGII